MGVIRPIKTTIRQAVMYDDRKLPVWSDKTHNDYVLSDVMMQLSAGIGG